MPDAYALNIERWRQRQRAAVGGLYGEQTAKLQGWDPSPALAIVTDGVLLDSRAKTTKHYTTQTWPNLAQDEKDIDAGTDFNTQIIMKFDRPINNVRNVTVPIFGPNYQNFIADPGSFNIPSVQAILYFTLLKVDLNSGTFKLEDLTWDLAHFAWRLDAGPSTLYSDSNNFVQFNSVPGFGGADGFEIYRVPATTTYNPAFGHNLTDIRVAAGAGSVDNGGSYWFYNSAGADTRQHGNLGPFTGIHLIHNPSTGGGAAPAPSNAGDVAFIRTPIPDPKPGAPGAVDGRFPFAIGDEFGVIDQ